MPPTGRLWTSVSWFSPKESSLDWILAVSLRGVFGCSFIWNVHFEEYAFGGSQKWGVTIGAARMQRLNRSPYHLNNSLHYQRLVFPTVTIYK